MRHMNWIVISAVGLALLTIAGPAFAGDGAVVQDFRGLVGLGAGLGAGLAVIGGGIGQGLTGKAACEGVARNPQASGKILVQAIVALAMTESLVILAWLMSYFLNGHLGA